MPNHPFDKQHRLKDFNYSSAGSYMITFNTAQKKPILSEIIPPDNATGNAQTRLTAIGQVVERYIQQIPEHYQNVRVDTYVIMPDHVHILFTFSTEEIEYEVQYSRLSRIEHALKSLTTKELGFSVWQLDYYDCIAFSDQEYSAYFDYITNNPAVWLEKNGAEAPFPSQKPKQ